MMLSRTQAELSRITQRPGELLALEQAIARSVDANALRIALKKDEKDASTEKGKEGKEGEVGEKHPPKSLGTAKKGVATGKTKVCSKCKLPKSTDRFPPHPSTSDKLAAWCKDCRAVLRKRRNQDNLVARLKHHFAARITQQLKDNGVADIPPLVLEMESYLGYKMGDLVTYLDDDIQDREGITLHQAFKKGYHVDHITPLSKFPFGALGDKIFRECWAMDNLRAIPAQENLKKGSTDTFGDDND